MTFYKAQFESQNFTFTAYGQTEAKAIEALKNGLRQHAKDYAIDLNWWRRYEGDMYAIEVGLDGCYRDNEPILEKP